MKRAHLIASFGLALILLLTLVAPTMAGKPVDQGYRCLAVNNYWITDTAGHAWLIRCTDDYGPYSNDYMYLHSDDAGVDINASNSSYEFDSSINMKKGIATMVNSYVNLTATASGNRSYYGKDSCHKPKWTDTWYGWGPGSLVGTVTVNSTVYTFNYTDTNAILFLEDYHNYTE